MRRINNIVLHCTATPQSATIESIQAYWRRMGWKNPGYHYIILPSGDVQTLATEDKITNGVAGHNAHSIHVAYIGGVDANGRPIDNRTQGQLGQMEILVKRLRLKYPNARILGHRDFSPDKNRDGIIQPHEWIKACPSFSVRAWLISIGVK